MNLQLVTSFDLQDDWIEIDTPGGPSDSMRIWTDHIVQVRRVDWIHVALVVLNKEPIFYLEMASAQEADDFIDWYRSQCIRLRKAAFVV